MSSAYPETGEYATIQAQAQDAYTKALANVQTQRSNLLNQYGYTSTGAVDSANPYGAYQQMTKQYGDQQTALQKQYGIKVSSDGTWAEDPSVQDGALQQLEKASSQTQFNAGLKATTDASGNPTDLTLSGDNPYGGFEQLLGSQGAALSGARDDALNRGLGTKGVGAQGVSSLLFGQAADRQSYRSQLLDTLTNNALQTRQTKDAATTAASDWKNNYGMAQTSLANQLANSLGDLDNQRYQASVDRDNADSSGYLQSILDAIAAGNFPQGGTPPPVTTTNTTKNGTSTGSMATGKTIAAAEAASLAKVTPKLKNPTPAPTTNAYNTNKNKKG